MGLSGAAAALELEEAATAACGRCGAVRPGVREEVLLLELVGRRIFQRHLRRWLALLRARQQ